MSTLAISTYFGNNTSLERIGIFKESISSLVKTNFYGNIYIVDDGSTITDHLSFVEQLRIPNLRIVRKPLNSGIARTKNTCLRLIHNHGDIGFLADDDLMYNENWWSEYENAIIKTNIHHFCAFIENAKTDPIIINNIKLRATPWVNGCFLTVTKRLIDDVGYFKVLEYGYGHEHSNFTLRCRGNSQLKRFLDVENMVISVHPKSHDIKSMNNIDREKMEENRLVALSDFSKQNCIE